MPDEEKKGSNSDRDDLVYSAKLAEQAERYDDMVEAMKEVAKMECQLSVEERNLLSVAYKNVIGARRASWRVLTSIHTKEAAKDQDAGTSKSDTVTKYRKTVETELNVTCDEILKIIEDNLLPISVSDSEATVFYHKMSGDYYRYLAEFKTEDDRNAAALSAKESYEKAQTAAEADPGLPPTHPIRLGLALNFSVFYYEILAKPDKACELAKSAFDDAIAELDSLQEDSYKDATLIMQLLRDNLTLWTSDNEEQ